MKRRSLLAALGTSFVAGCSGGWRKTDTETTDATARTTTTTTTTATTATTTTTADETERRSELSPVEDCQLCASVVELDTLDRTVALTPATGGTPDGLTVAATFDEPATVEGPTRLRATIRNPQNWAETTAATEVPLFAPNPSVREVDSDDETVWLAPTENHPLARTVPDWVQGPNGAWRLADETTEWLPDVVELGAGEAITGEYVLLSGADTPLSPGTYSVSGESDGGMQLSIWPTSAPGPDSQRSVAGSGPVRFENSEGDVETTWYAAADVSTTVYLTPSAKRIETPGAIEFALTNRSKSRLGVGPYDWRVYKRHGRRWLPLTWRTARTVGPGLLPGRTMQWSLSAFHGRPLRADDETEPCLGFLGGGRYAFAVRCSRGPNEVNAYATAFDVDAPSVTVRPDDGVTEERDGSVVRVDATTDSATGGTRYELERVSNADQVLIPEQVMQIPPLRNTLSFIRDGVERVVLSTSERDTGWLDADASAFVFEGEAFGLRTR